MGKTDTTDQDQRYNVVRDSMARFDFRKESLLAALNAAQDVYGYLSEELLTHISEALNVPAAHVYGVATFYTMYALKPQTGYCMVCTDPACAVAGGEAVLQAARKHASDNRAKVERATCLGLCDQAPAALMNGAAYVDLAAEEVGALLNSQAARSRLQVAGETRILTRNIGVLAPTDLEAHRKAGAFTALERTLRSSSPEAVIDAVKASGLLGRGGAGFPVGMKWQFTRETTRAPKYVVCNFDESEPGTFKDRVMMEGDPFRALEGIILCGYAIGAARGYIFVRGEYPEAAQTIQEAIDKLYAAGLLGKNILETDFSFDLVLRQGAGAYICGEETALFEAIEGNRGFPQLKPPFPTTHGLFNSPTVINNVETLALVPDIVSHGGEWLRQWGTEKSVGIKLFCLSGHVKSPGLAEAPFGITVRELIERYGGGFDGIPQTILMGGAAGGFLHPDNFDTPITNEDLNPLGAPVGSGVVMVFNQSVDLFTVLRTLARFFVHESCGQCNPCRIGTVQIYKQLEKLTASGGTPTDLDALERLCVLVKTTSLCGLGQTAPNPVLTTLKYFREQYDALVTNGAAQNAPAS